MSTLNISIDLLKLNKAGVTTINGQKCVVLPIDMVGLYEKTDNGKTTSVKLFLSASERKEVGQYGDTHYVKQAFSKSFKEKNPTIVEDAKKVYLGEGKPFNYNNDNNAQGSTAQAAPVSGGTDATNDDLPF